MTCPLDERFARNNLPHQNVAAKILRCFKRRNAARRQRSKAAPHERYLEAFRWMLQTRDLRGKTGQSLPRRHDHRRRLCRARTGSGQRGVRVVFAKGRRLRAAHPRPGGRARLLANRCSMWRALISVRARDRCADATATFTAAVRETGQLAMISHLGAMISGRGRQAAGQADEGRKGFCRPNDDRRRRDADRRDA